MVKTKSLVTVILSVMSLVFVGLFVAQAGGKQDKRQIEKRLIAQNSSRQKAEDEATPIREGVMTRKQKEHSKLFKGYTNITQGKKLRDLIAEKPEVNITRLAGDVGLPESFSLNEYLSELACKADVIIVGVVKGKDSQIIEDGTFVFTDYEITATDVLKNNAFAPILSSTGVTVTRIGGTVLLNGRKVHTIDQKHNLLMKGERYLLFLEYIPATGSYRAFSDSRSEDSFQIVGSKIIQVSPKPLPFGPLVFTDADPFLAKIRTTITARCKNQEGKNE